MEAWKCMMLFIVLPSLLHQGTTMCLPWQMNSKNGQPMMWFNSTLESLCLTGKFLIFLQFKDSFSICYIKQHKLDWHYHLAWCPSSWPLMMDMLYSLQKKFLSDVVVQQSLWLWIVVGKAVLHFLMLHMVFCRIEGAEINKSLLALKECIRALDND